MRGPTLGETIQEHQVRESRRSRNIESRIKLLPNEVTGAEHLPPRSMRTRVLALLTLLPHLAMSFSAGPLAAFAAPRVKQAYASAAASPYSHLQTAPFEECLAAAPFFCDQVQQHPAKLEDEEISAGLLCLLSSSNGLRAFFLSYLSDPDFTVADSIPPPPSLLTSLDTVCSTASATKFVSQLLLQYAADTHPTTALARRFDPLSRSCSPRPSAAQKHRDAGRLDGRAPKSKQLGGRGGCDTLVPPRGPPRRFHRIFWVRRRSRLAPRAAHGAGACVRRACERRACGGVRRRACVQAAG